MARSPLQRIGAVVAASAVSTAVLAGAAVCVAQPVTAQPVAGQPVAAPVRPAVLERPVPGRIVDPYRPPACRWCPGNRGVDLDARPGEPVRAPLSGTVRFAGPVGSDRFVVIAGESLLVTLGFVGPLDVAAGDQVQRGEVVAAAAGPVHLGVRRAGRYVDPTPLLVPQVGRPRLVAI
ncbi:MAG: murein hydrolase activator EnvC family protein [Acidimicrobiales bacterium]